MLGQTLDSIPADWINQVQEELRTEKFPYGRGLPPHGQSESRPLNVIPDEIVLEALRMILEVVYEPTFSKMSHGFQSRKSCRTAPKSIRTNSKAAMWAIGGGTSNCYGTINSRVLTEIIGRRIGDNKSMRLIRRTLRAGKCGFNTAKAACWLGPRRWPERSFRLPALFAKKKEILQGNNISPILASIYHNELD